MPLYDYIGVHTETIYDAEGNSLTHAYDVNGNVINIGNILKVMTYNVGGWYTGVGTSVPPEWDEAYYNMQNHILQENDADILCIEEYRNYFTTDGRTALSVLDDYYPYTISEKGDNPYMGKAICSKYPFIANSYYIGSFANEESRNYIKIGINYKGTELNIIVSHLSTAQNKRGDQAAELLEYADTLNNVILCGDFNTQYATSHSGQDYIDVYKPFADSGYDMGNCGIYGNIATYYHAATDEWRYLDNIITSGSLPIASAKVDGTKITDPITSDPNWKIDHIPFICEVIIPDTE